MPKLEPEGQDVSRFYYVYILVSQTDATHHYTGLTEDLNGRLKAHNSGQVPHTSKYRPWRIETAVAFCSREKALEFEKIFEISFRTSFLKKAFLISHAS